MLGSVDNKAKAWCEQEGGSEIYLFLPPWCVKTRRIYDWSIRIFFFLSDAKYAMSVLRPKQDFSVGTNPYWEDTNGLTQDVIF